MSTGAPRELPDYKRPPVVEIVVAVQFQPLRRFGMPEIVRLAQELGDDWQIADVPPALGRMTEDSGRPVEAANMLSFGFQPPPRCVFASTDGQWLAQIPSDRLAVHERKRPNRPSFSHVLPKLKALRAAVEQAVDADVLGEPHPPELVEVIYTNNIPATAGGVAEVLRSVSVDGLRGVGEHIDGFNQGFSTSLGGDGEQFEGRLRVLASVETAPEGDEALQLQLISRRYARHRALEAVLELSHADIVDGFTAITHESMHKLWGRFR